MSEIVPTFVVSALIIIAAGVVLTRCADQIADASGLGKVFVGSILLAGATSLPEFTVDLSAIRLNQPDLAVGDLLGSSLFNLLILALLDSVFRHPKRAFSSDFLDHAQSAALSIQLTGLVGIGILSRLKLSFMGAGIFMWIILGVYLVGLRFICGRPVKQSRGTVHLAYSKNIFWPSIKFVVSAGVILIVANLEVRISIANK